MRRDLLIAVSLANLCLVKTWDYFYVLIRGYYYFERGPSASMFAAGLVNVALLSALFYGAIQVTRKTRSKRVKTLARLGFLFLVATGLNAIRIQMFPSLTGPRAVVILGALALLAALSVARKRRLDAVVSFAAVIVTILSPLAALTLSQSVIQIVRLNRGLFESQKPAARASHKSGPRVLWVIFDGMDRLMAFDTRPADLKLPTFDALRGESLYAANAYAPGVETLVSIPAAMTGRAVERSATIAGETAALRLRYAEPPESVNWARQPNFFTEAHAAGFNGAIVGWYHPYCRMFGGQLVSCTSHSMTAEDAREPGLLPHMRRQLEWMVDTMPGMWRVKRAIQKQLGIAPIEYLGLQSTDMTGHEKEKLAHRLKMGREILAEGMKVATDPGIDVAFIHFSVPHAPYVYDRKHARFGTEATNSYVDNLAAADRFLSDLESAMKQTGTWDRTHLLVTADHGYPRNMLEHIANPSIPEEEENDRRVPFILKLAGQSAGLEYQPAFNTVLTHDLVLSLLKGEISSTSSAKKWLDGKVRTVRQ